MHTADELTHDPFYRTPGGREYLRNFYGAVILSAIADGDEDTFRKVSDLAKVSNGVADAMLDAVETADRILRGGAR